MEHGATTTRRAAARAPLTDLLLGRPVERPRLADRAALLRRVLVIRGIVAGLVAVILATTNFDEKWLFAFVIGGAVVPQTLVQWRIVKRRGVYPPVSLWLDQLTTLAAAVALPQLFPFALMITLAMIAFTVTVLGRRPALAMLAVSAGGLALVAARWHGENRWPLLAYLVLASASTVFMVSEFRRVSDRVDQRYDVLTGDLGLVVWEVNDLSSTRMTYVTDNVRELLGYEPTWFYEHDWEEYVHPDDRHIVEVNRDRVGRGEDHWQSYRARRADGSYRTIEEYVRVTRDQRGEVAAIWGVMTDASSKRAALDAADLWATVVSRLALPVFVAHLVDEHAEASLTITAANPAALAMVGHRLADPVGWRFADAFPELSVNGFAARAADAARRGHSVASTDSVSVVRGTEVRALAGHILALPNRSVAMVWTDVTDREVVAASLARAAFTDELTNLPNRSSLFTDLGTEIDRAQRADTSIAYLALDLDRFTVINESLGHQAGDELLRSVGARLFSALAGSGRLYRVGADHFGVLLAEPSGSVDVEAAGRKVLAALAQPFEINGYSILANATVGGATYPIDADDADTLVRRADMALHRAKRNVLGLAVYTPERDRSSSRSIALLGDLRRGIEAGELVPHYQPVLDLATGALVGAEALVRWHHPVEGMVMPLEFIEGAEVSGLVGPLTEHLARRVAADLERWQGRGHKISLSINLAARNVRDRHLAVTMAELMQKHRLPHQSICLEITERTVMHDLATSRSVLAEMRHRGFEVAVDDFGTGYSSLAVLRSIPLDELKLDKTFVDDMAGRTGHVVRSMVELGHTLGLRVVAEGVEDAETLARLRVMRCDRAQGWAIGRPVDAERFDAVLERAAAAGDDSWIAARTDVSQRG